MTHFTKEEIRNITNIKDFLSSRAVGDDRILPPNNTYTDITSITPNMCYYSPPLNLSSVNQLKIDSEGAVMEDNKLLELYMEKVDKDQRDLKEEIRESEKRTEKRIDDSHKRFEERMSRIESLITNQTDKLDELQREMQSQLGGLQKEVQNQLAEDKKYRHTNNIAMALGVIATILTMVGIYYATVSMMADFIGAAVK